MKARWIDCKYSRSATFYIGTLSLGSIEHTGKGYVGRGTYGFGCEPIENRDSAKEHVVKCIRSTLESQLKAINTLLKR